MRAIKLNKEIQCEYICGIVQKIVTEYLKHNDNLSESVLVLDIRKITDGGDHHIPKLEYKNSID